MKYGFLADMVRYGLSGPGSSRNLDETQALAITLMLHPRSLGYGPMRLAEADGQTILLRDGGAVLAMPSAEWQALVDKTFPADHQGYAWLEVAPCASPMQEQHPAPARGHLTTCVCKGTGLLRSGGSVSSAEPFPCPHEPTPGA